MPEVVEDTKKDASASEQAPPEKEAASNDSGTEKTGDTHDDFGYEVTASTESKESEAAPKAAPETKEKGSGYSEDGDVKGSTGYGDTDPEPVKAESEKGSQEEVVPKVEPTSDKDSGEFKVAEVGDLLPEEVTAIEDFAKTHKLSKEVAEALVAQKKTEVEKWAVTATEKQAEAKRDVARQRVDWHKELKDDKDFGGENFGHNIKKTEKVLDDFFPGMKNKLTTAGGMLPPYVMKDLAKLADHLYSGEKFVTGDTPAPPKKDEETKPWDYYN